MLMLHPIQPTRFAVLPNGGLFIIIPSVKNCFGMIKKISTNQYFEYVKKKKFGHFPELIRSIIFE